MSIFSNIISYIKNGDLISLNDYIEKYSVGINGYCPKFDLETMDHHGYTLLNLASEYGQKEIVEFLIEKGSNVNTKNRAQKTPLHIACGGQYVDIVRLLIKNKANVNTRCNYGTSPLIAAVSVGNFEIVKILINSGAEINSQDNGGESALFYAVKCDFFKIAKFLIDNGADLELKSAGSNTILNHMCSFYCKNPVEKIRFILNEGADLETRNIRDNTPLYTAVMFYPNDNLSEIVNLLLEEGSSIEFINTTNIHFLDYIKRSKQLMGIINHHRGGITTKSAREYI